MKTSLFISLCCSVAFYSSAVQAACVTPPSCDELGFTADASKCEGSFLKCPWDLSKAACQEKEETGVGAILYGDGTVSKDILDGKMPIGIVFDVENRLAMALTDVKKDGSSGSEYMIWSNNYYDLTDLENCTDNDISYGTDLTPITCGEDGRMNTNVILACSGSNCGGTPAATAANAYQSSGCMKDFCKKTKWFLPSLRDLQNIYIAKDKLNVTLTALSTKGATKVSENWYWSSTEYDEHDAWGFGMVRGETYWLTKTNNGSYNLYVRPVLAF